MSEFIDAASTPVALIFAVPLVVSLLLWFVTMLGIFDFDGEAVDGAFSDVFDSLGLAGVPPLVVFTIVSLVGWFIAVVAAIFVLDPLNGLRLLIGSVVVFGGSTIAAVIIGSRLAKPLGRLMETARAPSSEELVGREAVVRSGRVDATFGYADATWDDGTTSRVDVRDTKDLGLTAGDNIRLMGWNPDAGFFQVMPEKDLFGETGDN